MDCVKKYDENIHSCVVLVEDFCDEPLSIHEKDEKEEGAYQTDSAAQGCKEKNRRLHLSSKRQDAKPSQMPSRQLKPWMCPAIDNLFNFSASVKCLILQVGVLIKYAE